MVPVIGTQNLKTEGILGIELKINTIISHKINDTKTTKFPRVSKQLFVEQNFCEMLKVKQIYFG